MKKPISLICVSLCALVLCAAPLVAQQKAPGQQKGAVLPTPDVKATESVASDYQSASGALFTLGGGYYGAYGSGLGSILKPSWSVMLSANNNNLGNTLFGLGIDAVYARLGDKDVSGGIVYTTALPHITATFSVSNWFDVMLKGGPGISVLTSVLHGSASPSVSFTLGGGGGIVRVFGGHFVMGLEADYYYFFQRESSSSLAGFFYMGYRM